MLREGSFALASFGRVRKVHDTAFAVAFGRKSVARKRILDAAFESASSPGEATFADLMDVLLAIAFTPIDRLAFVRLALLQPVSSPEPFVVLEQDAQVLPAGRAAPVELTRNRVDGAAGL